ncbi:MAG: NUDIX hydrolase [Anaerolineae bacterium]|nr:NUDIX hydrolase [Anaerolineae bacterium]
MSDLDEKTLHSEPIHLGKLVKLYRDTVELPDGTQALREIIRHPGAVAAVALLDSAAGPQVLLVRQYRTAAQKALLEIPAGTLEPGEAPDAAMERELQEEIGYRPGTLERLVDEYTAPGYTTELIHIYLATDLTPSRLAGDADEFIETVKLPLDEALAMVLRGEIEDGKTIIGLLWAARRMGR